MSRTIDRIVIHHSADKRWRTHTWEDVRRWHLARGWRDIGYHLGVVFDDGRWQIKRGRPLDQIGAHAKGYNARSIGIMFEGNFELEHLSDEAYALGLDLVWQIMRQLNLRPTSIFGHRELPYPTLCPGRFFPMNRLRGDLMDRLFWDRSHAEPS